LPNNLWVTARNQTNTADLSLLGADANGNVNVGNGAQTVIPGPLFVNTLNVGQNLSVTGTAALSAATLSSSLSVTGSITGLGNGSVNGRWDVGGGSYVAGLFEARGGLSARGVSRFGNDAGGAALTGAIAIPNAAHIMARVAANNGDLSLITLDGGNNVVIGAQTQAVYAYAFVGSGYYLNSLNAGALSGAVPVACLPDVVRVIFRDQTNRQYSNTAAESTMTSCGIAAGLMGEARAIRYRVIGRFVNGEGAANCGLNIRVGWGGLIIHAGTINVTANQSMMWELEGVISNYTWHGAQVCRARLTLASTGGGSQWMNLGFDAEGTSTYRYSAAGGSYVQVDTSVAVALGVSGTMTLASPNCFLEHLVTIIELL
jgi:hypothetical protein